MTASDNSSPPPLFMRLYSVWHRHMLVYTRNLFSNGLPPFLEPLIFLAGVGLGLGKYIVSMDGVPYLQFLAAGLLSTSAMFTASFETTYGTFIRLHFDKVYDGMLSAPLTARDLIWGEMIWCGTKGLFFSFAVFTVISAFGIIPVFPGLFAPLFGFLTGIMFAAIGLFVTSFVQTINHFTFYFTGFLSPMFFFSGVIFPVSQLPGFLQPVAELMPLTHAARLMRAVCVGGRPSVMAADFLYCALLTVVIGMLAVRRLGRVMAR